MIRVSFLCYDYKSHERRVIAEGKNASVIQFLYGINLGANQK